MPRWVASLNRWARGDSIAPVASAARTATGNSGALDSTAYDVMSLLVDVTAVSGTTPSMTVSIETSFDGSTGWTQLSITSAITTVSQARLRAAGLDRFYRIVWTITGTTPSFTFSVAGEGK